MPILLATLDEHKDRVWGVAFSPDSKIIFGSSVRIMLLSSDQVMRTLVTEVIDGEAYCYYSLGEYTVRAVGICGERPTFKYTRIEIAGVLERLAAEESIDAIVQGFRGRVSREAIAEAGKIY